jgi:uncharacterized protein (TIGR02600 family)
MPPSHTGRFNANGNDIGNSNAWRLLITSNDVMESVQCTSGDLRLVAGHATIPPAPNPTVPLFDVHPLYGNQFAHSFCEGGGWPYYGATRGQLIAAATSYWTSSNTIYPLNQSFASPNNDMASSLQSGSGLNSITFSCEPEGFGSKTYPAAMGVVAGTATSSWRAGLPQGDFDNGEGSVRDGPYINKADEGEINSGNGTTWVPYFMSNGDSETPPGAAYFSPARQMSSAVMLGSLPTGVIGNKPWQTLLFHPDPTGAHAGAQKPMDHLLLDLFTMPVVEPYAISEPLSTAGRINMNYLIVPFTYINRDTGLRAVLESQQILGIPNTLSGSTSSLPTYKEMASISRIPGFNTGTPTTLRYTINLDETMKGFAQRFFPKAFGAAATPDIFRSPSEICTLDLVPNDTSDANAKFGSMQTYWQNHQLTGDNSHERPYANIYPLLTTKSNTFTVHFRVQTLQPAPGPGANAATWREGTDVVTSEYRGSQTIERYVDPSATLPDYAGSSNPTTVTPALNTFYRFRVVSTKQFSP